MKEKNHVTGNIMHVGRILYLDDELTECYFCAGVVFSHLRVLYLSLVDICLLPEMFLMFSGVCLSGMGILNDGTSIIVIYCCLYLLKSF